MLRAGMKRRLLFGFGAILIGAPVVFVASQFVHLPLLVWFVLGMCVYTAGEIIEARTG